MSLGQFYLVWNPTRGMPHYKHCELEEARTEAKRLAAIHPGEEFWVLAAMGRAKREEPVAYVEVDPIPF